jgi:hypothetical protein
MKNKQCNWLMCLVLLVSMLCNVDAYALEYFFTGVVDDNLSVPANWEIGTNATWAVPGDGTAATALFGAGDTAYIGGKTGEHQIGAGNPKGTVGLETLTAVLYAGASAGAGPVVVGDGYTCPQDGILDVYGALSATYLTLGYHGAENGNWVNGIVNVYDGGTINVTTNLLVGRYGWGSLNIYEGGLVACPFTNMGYNNGQGGEINLEGGVLQTSSLTVLDAGGANNATWIIAIEHGQLRILQDATALVQEYIDAGKIQLSSDLGLGWYLVYDYGVTNPGYTTVRTIRDPLERIPANESTVSVDTNLLQWTLLDPNDPVTPSVVSCDVYFGTEPNALLLPKVISNQAVETLAVNLELNQVYYWYIDVYDSQISTTQPYYHSTVYTFNTLNVPPVVNAGADVQTWLDGGPRVVQLNGSASHLHNLPLTHTWTILSEPDPLQPAVFNNAQILNPTVTLSTTGTYILQLESTDGDYIVTDTLQIILYSDACEHAANQPGFQWIAGDYNRDCKVNILDLAALSAQWLDWNYSFE